MPKTKKTTAKKVEVKTEEKQEVTYFSAQDLLSYTKVVQKSNNSKEVDPSLRIIGGMGPNNTFIFKQISERAKAPSWAIVGLVNGALEVFAFTSKQRMSGIARHVNNILRASKVRGHGLLRESTYIVRLEEVDSLPDCELIQGLANTLPSPSREEKVNYLKTKLSRGRIGPEKREQVLSELVKLGENIEQFQDPSISHDDIETRDSIIPGDIPE
jgi:hypothetical protein